MKTVVFYFFENHRLCEEDRMRVSRGVDEKILPPSPSDFFLIRAGRSETGDSLNPHYEDKGEEGRLDIERGTGFTVSDIVRKIIKWSFVR